jgi:hypothetical protein
MSTSQIRSVLRVQSGLYLRAFVVRTGQIASQSAEPADVEWMVSFLRGSQGGIRGNKYLRYMAMKLGCCKTAGYEKNEIQSPADEIRTIISIMTEFHNWHAHSLARKDSTLETSNLNSSSF